MLKVVARYVGDGELPYFSKKPGDKVNLKGEEDYHVIGAELDSLTPLVCLNLQGKTEEAWFDARRFRYFLCVRPEGTDKESRVEISLEEDPEIFRSRNIISKSTVT